MSGVSPPAGGDDPELADGLVAFAALSDALRDGVVAALPDWVARSVAARAGGAEIDAAAVVGAGEAAVAEVGPRLDALLGADPDDQAGNPLAVIREAVRFPTGVLRAAGVPPVERDGQAVAQFPHDDYDLIPASFAELDADLGELGLAWGAAKAWIHLRRRR